MTDDRRSILIDARVNGLAGAHGLARSVLGLAEHLGAVRAGLTVRALVTTGQPQIFSLSRLARSVELIPTDIAVGAFYRFRELARLIRELNTAVLYIPHPMLRPIQCPCPTVITMHDCIIESDVRFAPGWHLRLGQRIVTHAVLSRAAAVAVPTKASLTEVLRFYPGAPNPTVVPNGVDLRPFDVVRPGDIAAARDRYRLPEKFVLAVGAHRPHKNYETLVRAMLGVPLPTSLVIAGYFDPGFRQTIPGLIARLGLRERVILLPSVDDDLLPAIYRAASVFALPSLAEGFGIPALEAMAAGTPVVASDIDVLEEVCCGAATLVPADDPARWASALTSVIESRSLAAEHATAGRAVASAATWARGGEALCELLCHVARGETGH